MVKAFRIARPAVRRSAGVLFEDRRGVRSMSWKMLVKRQARHEIE